MTTILQTSTNLLGALFHGATEKFQKQCERSKKIFQTECIKNHSRHKFRLKKSKNDLDNSIIKYKKGEEGLKEILKVLEKNGFQITSAFLIRSRFILSFKKGERSYGGILAFPRPTLTLINIYARQHPSQMGWKTLIFSVQCRTKKNGEKEIVQRNSFLKGIINSMEEVNNG